VQIGHNVRVGAHTAMAAMSGAAGSTRIGKRCMIAGGAVMVGHLEICDDAVLAFRSVITHSITTPAMYSGTLPAEEASRWRRNVARFRRLDEMANRVRALERRLARDDALAGAIGDGSSGSVPSGADAGGEGVGNDQGDGERGDADTKN
jgi:UDP-3-O-[3-hydroxymyristoyl] glucosamine N-acyltransferase